MNKRIANIQYITQDSEQFSHAEQALAMFKKGVSWVQLRMKNSDKPSIIEEALKIQEYANAYQGVLILNDSVEIAMEIGAKAIHLGLNDLPINEAREMLGPDVIIGGTANTLDDILMQEKRGADYVGLGPFRHTSTKKNLSPIIGMDGYKYIANNLEKYDCKIPIFAVGGVTMDDISTIKAFGFHGVAVSSDLLKTI